MIITISVLAWYLSGFLAPVYYFWRDWDDPWDGVPIGLLAGLMGPVAWWLGHRIHNKKMRF